MLKDDEKLLNRFKSKLQCDISSTDIKRYKNQVNNIFRRYAGYYDFVDYKNAWGFISELEEILEKKNVNQKKIEEYCKENLEIKI